MLALLVGLGPSGCRVLAAYDPATAGPAVDGWADVTADAAVGDGAVDAAIADAARPDAVSCEPCDANCDGQVDKADVNAFVAALGGGNRCSPCAGDANRDGVLDLADITPFGACLPSPTACLSDLERDPYGSPLIKLCQNIPGGGRTQCTAEELCNTGWHLCTATEYEARSGGLPSDVDAWLAGCIRSGGAPHAPKNDACQVCDVNVKIGSVYVSWFPDGGGTRLYTPYGYVGVHATSELWRIGTDAPENQGYWHTNGGSHLPLDAALCCQ